MCKKYLGMQMWPYEWGLSYTVREIIYVIGCFTSLFLEFQLGVRTLDGAEGGGGLGPSPHKSLSKPGFCAKIHNFIPKN